MQDVTVEGALLGTVIVAAIGVLIVRDQRPSRPAEPTADCPAHLSDPEHPSKDQHD